jgi:hypothetical protein
MLQRLTECAAARPQPRPHRGPRDKPRLLRLLRKIMSELG